jgi:diguanylate cyclase (GGDEF)-like protein
VFLLLMAAELLFFYEGRGVAQYTTGVVTLLVIAALVARMVAAVVLPPAPLDRLAGDGAEQFAFVFSFLSTVIGGINMMMMASDELNRELIKLAHTDGLTGVLNRRRFLELAESEFRRARRHGRPLTLLILDIDRFKAINDRAGHPFGDRVIRAVADCCAARLREGDGIGRLGGEEFAVLLPETGIGAGERTAEDLRAAIEREVGALAAECGLAVTCSVGGVSIDRCHHSLADMIAQSDAALYDAKNAGRNRVRFAATADAQPVHA